MTEQTEDDTYDGEPRVLQTEDIGLFHCQAPAQPEGRRYLLFGGTRILSLPHVLFGFCLKPETTQQEADALAEMINKHCPSLWAQFFDLHLDDHYPEFDGHGLVKSEGPEDPRFSSPAE
jgi:hypothetical protein